MDVSKIMNIKHAPGKVIAEKDEGNRRKDFPSFKGALKIAPFKVLNHGSFLLLLITQMTIQQKI